MVYQQLILPVTCLFKPIYTSSGIAIADICFCGEAVNTDGEAARRLVRSLSRLRRSRISSPAARREVAAPPPSITCSRIPPGTQATGILCTCFLYLAHAPHQGRDFQPTIIPE